MLASQGLILVILVCCMSTSYAQQAQQNRTEVKVIRLVNCPPDEIIAPCRCSKFNVNYLKAEIMNSLYHNLDAYNNVNVYLICSFRFGKKF